MVLGSCDENEIQVLPWSNYKKEKEGKKEPMGTHSNYQINTYRVITKSLQNQNPQARKHESDKKDDLSPHEAE